MQYLLLVIALAAAVVLSSTFMPLRNDSLLPGDLRQELEQAVPDDIADPLPGDAGSAGGPDEPAQAAEPEASAPAYYRWRDSKGRWQYGDRPPPGVDYEPVDPSSTNTLSSEEFQGEVPRDEPE